MKTGKVTIAIETQWDFVEAELVVHRYLSSFTRCLLEVVALQGIGWYVLLRSLHVAKAAFSMEF